MKRSTVLLSCCGLLHSQSVIAAPSTVLTPSTPWNIDYSDDSCSLRRAFGQGDAAVAFELRQFAPGDSFELTLSGRSLQIHERAAQIRFLPDAKPHTIKRPIVLSYPSGGSGLRWSDSLFPPPNAAELANVAKGDALPARSAEVYVKREGVLRALEVTEAVEQDLILQTGTMHDAMKGMRACLDELVTHWGVDAATQKTLKRRAKPLEPRKWSRLMSQNFPETREEIDGIVRTRIMVSAEGRATSCHVQVRSQDPLFEKSACAAIMQATLFEPALDASGRPVASYYLQTVNYSQR